MNYFRLAVEALIETFILVAIFILIVLVGIGVPLLIVIACMYLLGEIGLVVGVALSVIYLMWLFTFANLISEDQDD